MSMQRNQRSIAPEHNARAEHPHPPVAATTLGSRLRRQWLLLPALAGLLIHLGTALLRLPSFLPFPEMVDFAAFYAGAWAVRLGQSPYGWSPDLLATLTDRAGLPFTPPILNSFPLWPWLLQPITLLPYPAAAWLWLGLLLALCAWCSRTLAAIAGLAGRRAGALLFLGVITFGPVTLTLTLGQSSLFLLALALLLGRTLAAKRPGAQPALVALWLPALTTKLFPLAWLAILPQQRRWPLLAGCLLGIGLAVAAHVLFVPRLGLTYLQEFLPGQIAAYSGQSGLDDQSLVAWLDRVGRPMQFNTTGLSTAQQHAVSWQPPWQLDPRWLRGVGYGGLALLALPVLWIARRPHAAVEGLFYLWLLFCLLPFPHTERYNHLLLLPAMAWLWTQGERGRLAAVLGYGLAGLARLTHLWVLLLPAPWGPLATGFGVMAVLLLGAALVRELWSTSMSLRRMPP